MKPVVHGTVDGYSNHGCRCGRCKKAMSEWKKTRRKPCPGGCGTFVYPRGKVVRLCRTCSHAARRKPLEHGTETGYKKGCRCDLCRGAATTARRARKARQ